LPPPPPPPVDAGGAPATGLEAHQVVTSGGHAIKTPPDQDISHIEGAAAETIIAKETPPSPLHDRVVLPVETLSAAPLDEAARTNQAAAESALVPDASLHSQAEVSSPRTIEEEKAQLDRDRQQLLQNVAKCKSAEAGLNKLRERAAGSPEKQAQLEQVEKSMQGWREEINQRAADLIQKDKAIKQREKAEGQATSSEAPSTLFTEERAQLAKEWSALNANAKRLVMLLNRFNQLREDGYPNVERLTKARELLEMRTRELNTQRNELKKREAALDLKEAMGERTAKASDRPAAAAPRIPEIVVTDVKGRRVSASALEEEPLQQIVVEYHFNTEEEMNHAQAELHDRAAALEKRHDELAALKKSSLHPNIADAEKQYKSDKARYDADAAAYAKARDAYMSRQPASILEPVEGPSAEEAAVPPRKSSDPRRVAITVIGENPVPPSEKSTRNYFSVVNVVMNNPEKLKLGLVNGELQAIPREKGLPWRVGVSKQSNEAVTKLLQTIFLEVEVYARARETDTSATISPEVATLLEFAQTSEWVKEVAKNDKTGRINNFLNRSLIILHATNPGAEMIRQINLANKYGGKLVPITINNQTLLRMVPRESSLLFGSVRAGTSENAVHSISTMMDYLIDTTKQFQNPEYYASCIIQVGDGIKFLEKNEWALKVFEHNPALGEKLQILKAENVKGLSSAQPRLVEETTQTRGIYTGGTDSLSRKRGTLVCALQIAKANPALSDALQSTKVDDEMLYIDQLILKALNEPDFRTVFLSTYRHRMPTDVLFANLEELLDKTLAMKSENKVEAELQLEQIYLFIQAWSIEEGINWKEWDKIPDTLLQKFPPSEENRDWGGVKASIMEGKRLVQQAEPIRVQPLSLQKPLPTMYLGEQEAVDSLFKRPEHLEFMEQLYKAKDLNVLAAQVGTQMIEAAKQIIGSINPSEMIGSDWQKDRGEITTPTIKNAIRSFDKTIFWAQAVILTADTPEKQVKAYEFLVRLQDYHLKNGNFNDFWNIYGGITQTPIERLIKSHADNLKISLSPDINKLLAKHKPIRDFAKNYAAIKKEMRDYVAGHQSCIPFVSIAMKELTGIAEQYKTESTGSRFIMSFFQFPLIYKSQNIILSAKNHKTPALPADVAPLPQNVANVIASLPATNLQGILDYRAKQLALSYE
jgi:hypothetical protein